MKSKSYFSLILALICLTYICGRAWAIEGNGNIVTLDLSSVPAGNKILGGDVDPVKYTLGPDDVISVLVLRHPEFSGKFPVNLEGKIQYNFVGDLEVNGLTKKQLEDKLSKMLGKFLLNPEVNVTIEEYKSKYIFVLGEVGSPGRYYMRSEKITVRDAVVFAGLPTLSASMRRCHLITPRPDNKQSMKYVDIYSILYGGDLKRNVDMHTGDVLYVPSTIMAKIIRVINPITQTIGVSTAGPTDVSGARSAVTNMAK